MCVMIGQQVCFHSAMKHENDMSSMVKTVSKLWLISHKVFVGNLNLTKYDNMILETCTITFVVMLNDVNHIHEKTCWFWLVKSSAIPFAILFKNV